MTEQEKLVIVSTIGVSNPEKATIPFVMATAAQAMDIEVVVILQADAVVLAKIGEAEKLMVPEFLPLKNLLDSYVEMGGKINLCSPCLKSRGITKEELIDGSIIIAAGTVISEVISAKSVLSY